MRQLVLAPGKRASMALVFIESLRPIEIEKARLIRKNALLIDG
jgi:hypothetical protein